MYTHDDIIYLEIDKNDEQRLFDRIVTNH